MKRSIQHAFHTEKRKIFRRRKRESKIKLLLLLLLLLLVVLEVQELLFFFQAEDGIRDVERSRGLGDVYKRQSVNECGFPFLTVFLCFSKVTGTQPRPVCSPTYRIERIKCGRIRARVKNETQSFARPRFLNNARKARKFCTGI